MGEARIRHLFISLQIHHLGSKLLFLHFSCTKSFQYRKSLLFLFLFFPFIFWRRRWYFFFLFFFFTFFFKLKKELVEYPQVPAVRYGLSKILGDGDL
jgi:hypothetical protein